MYFWLYAEACLAMTAQDAAVRQHIKRLKVSNSELKRVQRGMMKGKIELDYDPLLQGYEQRIAGHVFDPENDENTLKAIKNINTPLTMRVLAGPAVYLAAMHHE
ncbi:hypothetical protein PAPHI01_0816 [Pancytospora philotis]|nr:hypothetical protein PAPHI01_0816 [Pancytospora philotis]